MKRNYALSDFGVQKHELVLDNGLRTIFIEKPYAPIFAKIMVRAGSVFNPSDNGLAHLTEHLVVGASQQYPGGHHLFEPILEVGGYANAMTGPRIMDVRAEIATPEHLDRMQLLFSEALTHIYLTDDLLQKEIRIVAKEIAKAEAKPSYHANLALRKVLAEHTPWEYSNLGKEAVMRSITKEDIVSFFETQCTVENMALVVCGGCSLSDIQQTFGTITFRKGGKEMVLPESPPIIPPNRPWFFEQSITESNIGVLFSGPPPGTRESAVINFAMRHAHIGLGSRFYRKIRGERALAYGVSQQRLVFNETVYTGTEVGTSLDKTDEVIEAILECYAELLHDGMSQAAIDAQIDKDYFTDRRTIADSIEWANIFDDHIYPDPACVIGDYPDIFRFYHSITPEEVSTVLKRYITPDSFHLFINGKEGSKKYQ